MNQDEHIQRLSRAADWRAALLILHTAFAQDGRVWRHVHLDREEIAFKKILSDGTFSSGEYILLAVAASLFNPQFQISLWEVFNRLDDPNADLVLSAIRSFRGGFRTGDSL